MNKIIVENLDVEESLIKIISTHLSESGGKRIRPIITLLTAKMFDAQPQYNQNAIYLAAAVEFIHMATLLHDDVVDGSKMRRFLPTANIIWGSKASILVGDFLFSQSFRLIVSTESIPALIMLSNASAIIAKGEVTQLVQLEQKNNTSEDEYLSIIHSKTAELFGASCAVGAIIAGKLEYSDLLKNFGIQLGVIFQIADDMLDYCSDNSKAGKNIGDDFFEGKITLPLILLKSKLSHKDNNKFCQIMTSSHRSNDDLIWVKTLIDQHNITHEIKTYLHKLSINAINMLNEVKITNQSCQYLKSLVEFAINRTY